MNYIQKVVVIGAGEMGAGIAAQLANAQCSVLLLDIPHESDRNKLANDAIERMKKQKPAPFMDNKFANLIVTGNTEDDLDKIKDYDWVIEAIFEKLEVKQDLYRRIDSLLDGRIIVTSNTSSIRLSDLIQGRSEEFQKNFIITHFFNPPRYMRLLEFITSAKTNPEIVDKLKLFADERLGKTVVYSHDTPAFIGNRIGTYVALCALDEAKKSNLKLDEIDNIFSKAFDVPKTGIFALFDLVGLDILSSVGRQLIGTLPLSDPIHKLDTKGISAFLNNLIHKGYTGRKGLGGFYRMNEENGKRVKEQINLKTGEFESTSDKIIIPSLVSAADNLKAFLSQDDEPAFLARKIIFDAFYYSAYLVPEITDDIINIDRAIRLGFGWKLGPFEMMDKIGPSWLREQFKAEGRDVPRLLELVGDGAFYKLIKGQRNMLTTSGSYKPIIRPEGVLRLKDLKDNQKPLLDNPGARLWDIGDEVVCFEFKTKENTFTPDVFEMIKQTIELVQKEYKALVIYNETDNFSLGMNLDLAVKMSSEGNYDQTALEFQRQGQEALMSLKLAPFPVVGAPAGLAVGGGCELLLHCNAVVAHAELYIGLVEIGLGIVPGWGGCKEMLLRAQEFYPGGTLLAFRHIFETIGSAKVATSAYHAKHLLFLHQSDEIVMNKDRVLYRAKQKALSLVEGYVPPVEQHIRLPGKLGMIALNIAIKSLRSSSKISDYDMVVAGKLAYVVTGGPTNVFRTVSEQQLFDLEIEANRQLSENQLTRDRFLHYVNTGKILRN